MANDDDRLIQLDLDQFEDPDGLPDSIAELIATNKFVVGGEREGELELLQGGRCLCCHGYLGENTTVSLNAHGITTVACSGLCNDDLVRLGYLTEQAQDIIDSIEARRSMTEGHD